MPIHQREGLGVIRVRPDGHSITILFLALLSEHGSYGRAFAQSEAAFLGASASDHHRHHHHRKAKGRKAKLHRG